MKKLLTIVSVVAMSITAFTHQAHAVPAYVDVQGKGLLEGDLVSAGNSGDPDIFIVKFTPQVQVKRLFLNPAIFGFYAHLGGFSHVKQITPDVRDAFETSGLFRNCETNAPSVWAVEVTGEDTGILHHVQIDGAVAAQQDPYFFSKVFCINSREENFYPKSITPYTALNQVPRYGRNTPGSSTEESRMRDLQRIADVNKLRIAANGYFDDHHGGYPATQDALLPYLTSIPGDPSDGTDYGYYGYGGSGVQIWARLESFAPALNGDNDLELGIDGSLESCTNRDTCIYDVGDTPLSTSILVAAQNVTLSSMGGYGGQEYIATMSGSMPTRCYSLNPVVSLSGTRYDIRLSAIGCPESSGTQSFSHKVSLGLSDVLGSNTYQVYVNGTYQTSFISPNAY